MGRTRSAQKKDRQDRKRRVHNRGERSRMRTVVKKVSATQEPVAAAEALKEAQALLDRLATRRLIHPNKAARKKSQLARAVAKLT